MSKQIPRGAVVCRYSTERWMKVIIGVVVAIIFPVWMLFERDPSKPFNLYGFAGLVLFIFALQVCAIVFTSKRLIVSDEGVAQRTVLRERRVTFDEILVAERHVDRYGEEELTIHCIQGRLRCNGSMELYRAFVECLSAHVPVHWREKGTLTFPVRISLRKKAMRNALETILGFVLGFICAFGSYHYFAEVEQPEWSWVIVLGGLALVFVVGGVLSQREFFGAPRGYVFWPNYFDVRLPRFTGRVYGVAVQDVGLRFEKDDDAIVCKLLIKFNEMVVEIASTDTTVPLEPLCNLLREAYLREKQPLSVEPQRFDWANTSARPDRPDTSQAPGKAGQPNSSNPFDQPDKMD